MPPPVKLLVSILLHCLRACLVEVVSIQLSTLLHSPRLWLVQEQTLVSILLCLVTCLVACPGEEQTCSFSYRCCSSRYR